MAKREGRLEQQDPGGSTDLEDYSRELWDPQLSEVTRALLTSAVRCFAANGYHGTTTRDISSGAGLSPAALYVHFSSKELVLFEIIRAGHERALDHLRYELDSEAADPGETLRRLVKRYTAWHARHHVAARVCQYQHRALTPEHYAQIRALRSETNEVFRNAVARGVKVSELAAADVNRIARAIMSLSIDLVRWYRLDGNDSPTQLGDFYADLALTMVFRNAPRTATPTGGVTRPCSA